MELHSYAKRKVAKKWSIEQKRKLVEARIANDGLFTSKPTASVAPWKKVLSLAKLDDYNVFFVRKQWSNMVNKYKQYKQNRLDPLPNGANDPEEIRKLTEEWEFFQPIHYFMLHKTTNLHSYALPITIRLPQNSAASAEERQDNRYSSSPDIHTVYSSDTNDGYNTSNSPKELEIKTNTDHDFYTKKNGLPLNYFADISNDTQESMLIEQPIIGDGVTQGIEQIRLHVAGEQIVVMKMEPSQSDDEKSAVPQVRQTTHLTTNIQMPGPSGVGGGRKRQRDVAKRELSERDRYYRHKRHFNRRLERRFDAILNVFGQIVKAEYPNINVSPIVGAATQGFTFVNQLFKSENDDSGDEDNGSSSDTEKMQFSARAYDQVNEEIISSGQSKL
ncbi:uncharacterized protein [Eurosta solidaginis]|uniref:uncharacterized protein n=1 Tax=Eurosta solidaginis TaxID=178769 RepID=UPI003530DD3B